MSGSNFMTNPIAHRSFDSHSTPLDLTKHHLAWLDDVAGGSYLMTCQKKLKIDWIVMRHADLFGQNFDQPVYEKSCNFSLSHTDIYI